MRQHILSTALLAAVSALAYGQNLNPTVEVTNAYEGGAASIVKPAQVLAVPDTVMQFNLDFDYSVFEKPYQGAYEFKPYYVQLKPTPRPSTQERFYLRLGAGYTLHPELELVWAPLRRENLQVDVYANHRSYFGKYHQFDTKQENDVHLLVPSGERMGGYLADTKAGVDGTYAWEGGVATLDLGYRNRMANDAYHYQKMGGLEAAGRVRSFPTDEPHFLYDAAVNYHFFGSDFSHESLGVVSSDFTESLFAMDGTFGSVLGEGRRIVADLDVDLVRYRGDMAGYTGLLSVTPKYEFSLDRWGFSLGARVSSFIYSDDFSVWPEQYRRPSGILYPDVHVDFHLLDDRLILQTSATGGDRFHTLSGRFFSSPFSGVNEFGHSRERIRAMLGARGNIASRFRYDLQSGFARWKFAPVEGFAFDDRSHYQTALYESDYNLLFVELDYGWKSDHVTVDGKMSYRWTDLSAESVFTPASFVGWIRPAWHWGDRFTAGLDVAWSTRRRSSYRSMSLLVVPGWVDLGLNAEYRFTRHFGFWVKGGNLLGQAIQRIPVHAQAGMYFTAGILLNF